MKLEWNLKDIYEIILKLEDLDKFILMNELDISP